MFTWLGGISHPRRPAGRRQSHRRRRWKAETVGSTALYALDSDHTRQSPELATLLKAGAALATPRPDGARGAALAFIPRDPAAHLRGALFALAQSGPAEPDAQPGGRCGPAVSGRFLLFVLMSQRGPRARQRGRRHQRVFAHPGLERPARGRVGAGGRGDTGAAALASDHRRLRRLRASASDRRLAGPRPGHHAAHREWRADRAAV